MQSTITTTLLLVLVLLLLVAPFSAVAPLMLILLVSVLGLMGWTILRALVTGKPGKSDRPYSAD